MKNNTLATLVIARLCRAFFMHIDRALQTLTERERDVVIARLCRAFFIHFHQR